MDKTLDSIVSISKKKNNFSNVVTAHLFHSIDNMFYWVQSSPYLLSILIAKLIDMNYMSMYYCDQWNGLKVSLDLCMSLINSYNNSSLESKIKWEEISSTLTSISICIDVSSDLCQVSTSYFDRSNQ